MSAVPEYDYVMRMVVVGDSGVGKSSLVLRFTEDRFTESYVSTIGVDFMVRSVTMRNDRVCKIVVWDTAGQERFRAIVSHFYRGAGAALIAYDVTRRETFENVRSWIDEIENRNPRLLREGVLVATKMDMPREQHCVSRAEGEALAREYGLMFFETSAKDDGAQGTIHDMFVAVAERACANDAQRFNGDKVSSPSGGITIMPLGKDPYKTWRCCTLL